MLRKFLFAVLLGALSTATACSRSPQPARSPAPNAGPGEAGQAQPGDTEGPEAQVVGPQAIGRLRQRQGGGDGFRPYAQVIPSTAITRDGMFRTHLVDDRLYFEIPSAELGREMILLIRNMTDPPPDNRGARVYRWERNGNRIQLWQQNYNIMADSSSTFAAAVTALARGPLIASFDIETLGRDSAAVIEVTRLFLGNIPEFGSVRGLVPDRSYIEKVTAFDKVVNVVATQTGMTAPEGAPNGTPAQATTERIHWSLMRLPETAMSARLYDSRIGFNSIGHLDFAQPDHSLAQTRFILKHRLEKRDPNAAVSEPVQPIVYYIDRATPEWLVPYVLAGVDAWNVAFEEAGFSHAIEGRLAPTTDVDPDFSLFDARYSVIHWRPSTVENANGGLTPDPRSGEVLRGEVNVYHNILNILRNWYFTQVGPLDPRAQALPLPDSLMGNLVKYVITHEIGHTIGLMHNFKGAAMYPADSLRSATFLERMGGHAPTVMDYSRFNYVAQPEDQIPLDLLIPAIGPYDRFAVRWGYAPIPEARSPQEEVPHLDSWAHMQDTIPWLRFDTPGTSNDPMSLTEDVGGSDPVYSSTLALKNLNRVMEMLLPAAEKPGQDYELLSDLYGEVVTQWGRYNGHVAAIIGGAETQEKRGTGERFTPISRDRQKAAMDWLAANAFMPPRAFLREDILLRIEAEGSITRIRNAQASVLGILLNEARISRLIEYEALITAGEATYKAADLMSDLRRGVWGELDARAVSIDVYRRNLQRAHLRQIDLILNPPRPPGQGNNPPPPPPMASDLRPLLRAELRELDRRVAAAQSRVADPMTGVHLADTRAEIGRILGN